VRDLLHESLGVGPCPRPPAYYPRGVPAALRLALDALYLGLALSLPALAAAWLVSALLGFLQSVTKLGEPALSAIPRAVSVLIVVALSATWMAGELGRFTERLLRSLPELVR
jgi:flagellar biosynthesis protein FliQ